MIVFGTCVGFPDRLQKIAVPGVLFSMNGEGYRYLTPRSNGHNIFPVMQGIIEEARRQDDVEALVLMHDDLEIRDLHFAQKIREIFASDPDVAIIGCIGTSGPFSSLNWWEGERKRGHIVDNGLGLHDWGFGGDNACEVDTVDGMLLILSPWAVQHLTLAGCGYDGLHGYAEELCAQARHEGKGVIVTPLEVHHHSKGGVTGDRSSYDRAGENFQKRWMR